METSKWIKQWEVPSHSKPGKTYRVSVDADGIYSCSCPHHIFRQVTCKHIEEVVLGSLPSVAEEEEERQRKAEWSQESMERRERAKQVDKARWIDQWDVPSEKDPEDIYKVSLDHNNRYCCSCKRWIFSRKDKKTGEKPNCKHINQVIDGQWPSVFDLVQEPYLKEPPAVLCACREVCPVYVNGQLVRIMVPLIPLGRSQEYVHFFATVISDQVKYGIPLQKLRKKGFPYDSFLKDNKFQIQGVIKDAGRCVWGPPSHGEKEIHGGFVIVQDIDLEAFKKQIHKK